MKSFKTSQNMTGVSWQNYSLFLPGPTKNWQLKITIIFLSILSYYFYRDELKCEVRVPSDFMSVPRLTPSCSRWTLSTSGGRPRSLTSGSWCSRTSCLSTSRSETSCVPATVANVSDTELQSQLGNSERSNLCSYERRPGALHQVRGGQASAWATRQHH